MGVLVTTQTTLLVIVRLSRMALVTGGDVVLGSGTVAGMTGKTGYCPVCCAIGGYVF